VISGEGLYEKSRKIIIIIIIITIIIIIMGSQRKSKNESPYFLPFFRTFTFNMDAFYQVKRKFAQYIHHL
jgi:hypothetical protein